MVIHLAKQAQSLASLQAFQKKRAVRAITNSDFGVHSAPLFSS